MTCQLKTSEKLLKLPKIPKNSIYSLNRKGKSLKKKMEITKKLRSQRKKVKKKVKKEKENKKKKKKKKRKRRRRKKKKITSFQVLLSVHLLL